jgi:hypothetical protein
MRSVIIHLVPGKPDLIIYEVDLDFLEHARREPCRYLPQLY